MELNTNTMVAVRFWALDGDVYNYPDNLDFLGFYVPTESDLEKFDGDIAVFLDAEEVEFLTPLGMVTTSNFCSLLPRVENALQRWWKDNKETVEDYYWSIGERW